MPLNLPAPSEEPLAASPLALVVFQLRFEAGRVVNALAAARLSEALADRGYDFAKTDAIQTLTINLAPAGVESSGSGGWRLQTADGVWIITLGSDAISLETTRYGSWKGDFGARLQAVLEAAAAVVEPQAEMRTGLRFVDIVTRPEVRTPSEWRGRIEEWLLAPALDARVGNAIKSFQQQVVVDVGEGVQATIRHGSYPDVSRGGAHTYLLDTDVYRDRVRGFDIADVTDAAQSFHRTALALFQTMITPAFRQELNTPA